MGITKVEYMTYCRQCNNGVGQSHFYRRAGKRMGAYLVGHRRDHPEHTVTINWYLVPKGIR